MASAGCCRESKPGDTQGEGRRFWNGGNVIDANGVGRSARLHQVTSSSKNDRAGSAENLEAGHVSHRGGEVRGPAAPGGVGEINGGKVEGEGRPIGTAGRVRDGLRGGVEPAAGSIESDPALVTAMPCHVPAASQAVSKDTEDATSRMLARKASSTGLATNSCADIRTPPGALSCGELWKRRRLGQAFSIT